METAPDCNYLPFKDKEFWMAAIRLYLCALTLTFFLGVVITTGIGVLEAIVIASVPLILILDMREELSAVKALEKRIATLSQ